MKILIADDDENSRVFLERALLKQGYHVESAQNGAQALAKADRSPPGLIISDILMPEVDGFELCRRVKTDDRLREIPFVFYSATYVAPEDKRLAMELGCSRFLVKPMELADFTLMIREVIGECSQGKLPVPDRPHAELQELDRLHIEALTRKLEKKIGEAARERQARMRSEEDYRQLKDNLKQLISQAVEAERKKDDSLIIQGRQAVMGEMINNIAHQWRQPINTLGLLAQDLQMTYKFGDFNKAFIDANLKKTMAVIQGMSRTIDDFRTFFKPDREKVEFKVLKVVSRIRSFLEESFKAENIVIEVQSTADPAVIGYPGEFYQVLLNILLNAKEAFAVHKVDNPVVTLRVCSKNGRTIIVIADNAGGIPARIIDRVFDPYFTTKGPDRGTGIGLFMSKNVIERNMGGSLTVRNFGKGAEFRIEL